MDCIVDSLVSNLDREGNLTNYYLNHILTRYNYYNKPTKNSCENCNANQCIILLLYHYSILL